MSENCVWEFVDLRDTGISSLSEWKELNERWDTKIYIMLVIWVQGTSPYEYT